MMQYASGPRNDPNTQAALNILNNAAAQRPTVGTEVASYTKGLPPTVYIQIANEQQRRDAQKLESALRSSNFTVPDIELVPHPSSGNFVRYFSPEEKSEAETILGEMEKLGYNVRLQDFSEQNKSNIRHQFEVWIAQDQKPLAGG